MSNYDVLTSKVNELIKSYSDLKKKNKELEAKITGYENELNETKVKIDSIISKIEELEGDY